MAYLTEIHSGRTWVSTLEPFRAARRAGREASAVALAAPYADLDSARRYAPRLANLAQWLKARRLELPPPAIDELPQPVVLSGAVVAGLHIIDPATGRQLVTLRSHSLHAGQAALALQEEALRLSQDGAVVYFPLKDLFARWGNQLTRSANYATAEDARKKAAELETRRLFGALVAQALVSSREPDAELLARLETFDARAETIRAGRKGTICLVLALPPRFGGSRKIAFGLKEFGPRTSFTPALWWVPHQGLMVLFGAPGGTVVAFGVGRGEARRFGVFHSAAAAREAALLNPGVLITEALLPKRARESGNDLLAQIARFNNSDLKLKTNNGQVSVANIFTGATFRFRTSSSRGLWSPKILLSLEGPLLVMYARNSVRRPSWRVYGPLLKQGASSQLLEPSRQGRGYPTLGTLAVLLSKQLSVRVTVVDPNVVTEAKLDDVHYILRRVIPEGFQNWHDMERDAQVRLFYEFADVLRDALLSVDAVCRRDALVAAEYFYFSKPSEQILNLHAPLLKSDAGVWSAILGEGGRADTRAKEMVRTLGYFLFERPKKGLMPTMQSRFGKFQDSIIQMDSINVVRPQNIPKEFRPFQG